MSPAIKFGLFGSGIGGAIGFGAGAYYGGALGAIAGTACGLFLGPPSLLVTTIAVGLACLAAAAAIAVPCFLGYLLMKSVFWGCVNTSIDIAQCCTSTHK